MILPLDAEVTIDDGGGKAANLARLTRAGFAVPRGFVITTSAYREFVSANGLDSWVLESARAARIDDPASVDATSAAIRARFESGSVPPELVDAIRSAYAALGEPPVAVRSSATTEDLPELSFAGQQDTILNVVGDAALQRAVIQCWSSLWTARAIGYRGRNDIAHETAALAVVVQEMVASELSGVLFTANPLTGKRAEIVIDATFGLGEALVAGRVEPDHYVVDATGSVLHRRIGAKSMSIRAREGGGTVEASEDAAQRPTLVGADVSELASVGREIATLFGTPQDVEWARADGRFHILQSRPITSLFPLPEAYPGDGLRVLISFGAFQGMLDPITPLGQDVFGHALPHGLASIGVPLEAARRFVFAGERAFIDITPFVRSKVLRARLRAGLRAIEPTTGEALDDVLQDQTLGRLRSRLRLPAVSGRFLAVLSRALGNLTYNLLRPHHGRVRIQRRLASAIEAFERQGAAARTLSERIALLDQAFEWAVQTAFPLLLPGFGVGLAGLQLLRDIAAALPDGERRVLELTRGLPHNVTTEMDLALWDVARTIRADAGAATHFLATDPAALARDALAGALPPSTQAAIDAFLHKYGMRGVAEIDLGRPRWRDDPTSLIEVLKSYLRIEDGEQAPDATFRRGSAAAERTLASLVTDIRRTPRGRLKAIVMGFAARRMRALAGLRESPKFTIISMLGVVRAALLQSGRDLVSAGTLDSADDVFFLHRHELTSLAAGQPRDWRALVRARRETYAREQRRRRVPRVLLSDGRAFFGGTRGDQSTSDAAFTGSPVSPGVAEGFVRVVLDPRGARLQPGEILVCRGTDPAWTPLFLAAGGLVTEVGGLMTHGSVVAREYGIPAVVGVHEATARLHTGERIRVDGTTGRVTILGEARRPATKTLQPQR